LRSRYGASEGSAATCATVRSGFMLAALQR
jgi:hypothetical protein